MRAQNISGRKIKVEYGFNNVRKRELLEPDQIIEIDELDYQHLNKLGVFVMGEMTILQNENIDKMAQAKIDAENYIKQNN